MGYFPIWTRFVNVTNWVIFLDENKKLKVVSTHVLLSAKYRLCLSQPCPPVMYYSLFLTAIATATCKIILFASNTCNLLNVTNKRFKYQI